MDALRTPAFASLKRWFAVFSFGVAMAWVEAATVVYLRTLVNRIEPYQANPLPETGLFGEVELVREAATLLMLFSVGWLAGRNWRCRLAYACIAFGLWDIFYYLFLKLICGWPRSLLDWDVLFLLPLPWWGPVIAPVLIALMMIFGGTMVARFDQPGRAIWPGRWSLGFNAFGIVVALYVFMADAIRVLGQGSEAIRNVCPLTFHWPLFLLALALMSVALVDLLVQIARRNYGSCLGTGCGPRAEGECDRSNRLSGAG